MKSRYALRRFTGAGILFFCISLSTALAAGRRPVEYDVSVGFGGLVPKEQALCPVTVTIENQVASTRGTITISQPDTSGSVEVKTSLPFDTPSPSVKRFPVLIRLEPGRDMALSIAFEDFIKPIRKTLRVKRSTKPMVLCVAVHPQQRASVASEKYRFVNIDAQSLPEDALALDGIHAVMLSGLAFTSLDKSRIDALQDWVATGGRLILPDCPSDEAFLANFKRLAASANINPVLRKISPLGVGVVACGGTSTDTGNAFWENSATMTRILFPKLSEEENQFDMTGMGSGHFSGLWRTKRTYGVLAFGSILVIVGAYILAIGPVDWWLVRRFKKPYLTWILFSGSIALFSLIAYSYSNLVNVGSMRAVQVNIVDTSLDMPTAKGNSQLWVYSAKNTTYNMETPLKGAVFSARESALGAGLVAGVNIQNDPRSRIKARIPIFSSKTFDATWIDDWKHEITCAEENERLSVSLPKELKASHIYLADRLGLTELREEDNKWSSALYLTDWNSAITSRVDSLGSRYTWGSSKSNLLPREQQLMDYLVCLSFPWKVRDDDNDWRRRSMYRGTFDAREITMDIRHRVEYGRVLLIFLKTKEPLLPVSFSRHRPKKAGIDLIRLQIPEDFDQGE